MMSASANKETRGDSETEMDPPVVSRTRSGRRVRTPAALLDSGTPATKTPVRRTRKSVIREDPAESSESGLPESKSSESIEQTKVDPCVTVTESTTVEDNQVSRQPVLDSENLKESDQTSEKENTVSNTDAGSVSSTDPEKKAKKRNRSESTESKCKMVPLGKPKSGRVWKDRNKQR